MSVDYWWLFFHLSSAEEAFILPFYQNALQKAILSNNSKDILQQWRNNPKNFIFTNNDWVLFYNRFISAFIVDSFQNFGEQLISEKLIPGWKLNDNNCFDFISINRCSPVAALFYAL